MEENRNIRQEIAECEKLLIGLGEEWKAEPCLGTAKEFPQ